MFSTVRFEHLAHLVTVPVLVGDAEARFVFDTGIGVNLIFTSLASMVGCEPTGTVFRGRRMSGTEVTVPIASVKSLGLGACRHEDVPVGSST